MNIGLFYFSGTGMTAELAKSIANEFRRLGHTVEFTRFTADLPLPDLAAYDVIGFGAPVYSFNAPRIFLRYLRSLDGPEGIPYVLFITSHSASGITAASMDRILRRKRFRRTAPVIEGMGVNNIRAWRRKRDKPGHRDVFLIRGDVREWAESALRHAAGPGTNPRLQRLRRKPGLVVFSWLFTWRWQMALVEGLRKKIDRDRCTKCGLCWERICPSGAIRKGEDGFPEILQRKCVGCSGCVNLCPADAVYTRINKNRWPCDIMKTNIIH